MIYIDKLALLYYQKLSREENFAVSWFFSQNREIKFRENQGVFQP